jgi:hypothetical protein
VLGKVVDKIPESPIDPLFMGTELTFKGSGMKKKTTSVTCTSTFITGR